MKNRRQQDVIERFQRYWTMVATRPELDRNLVWEYALRLSHLRRSDREQAIVYFTSLSAIEPARDQYICLFTDVPPGR